MRIGILTFHRAYNCGAVLQAWALMRVLQERGHDVEFPDCNHVAELPGRFAELREGLRNGIRGLAFGFLKFLPTIGFRDVARLRYRSFAHRYLPIVNGKNVLSRYDLIIVGSDQVWNPGCAQEEIGLFLGETVPRQVPMIGYSLSSGDAPGDASFDVRVRRAVGRFKAISVREESTRELIRRAAGCDCAVTLDPTLLLDVERYEVLANGRVPNEPYVLFYVVTGGATARLVPEICRQLGVKRSVYVDGRAVWRPGTPRGQRYSTSPGQFLRLMKHAAVVVACSFHGTVFALLNRKPFVALSPEPKANKKMLRVYALLKGLGCEDRIVALEEPVESMVAATRLSYPDDFDERLQGLREQSYCYLDQALQESRA